MPLLKRKSLNLVEPPKDLESHELVYQVRFTKEIFRDYQAYLNRLNLYRKRVWTCKSTGKTNLTYEEALVSERRASEKFQSLPKELVEPALHIIQFSMLPLKDLADTLASKLQECFFPSAELHGKRNGNLCPCKILKISEEGSERQYEVGWFDKDKKIYENSVLHKEDLSWKKFPFSRNFFKSFIRESTNRSIPWMVRGDLAQAHGISSNLPKELRGKYFFQNGQLVHKRKRKTEGVKEETREGKKTKLENGVHKGSGAEDMDEGSNKTEEESIRYPIDDLLVKPSPDDPVFSERPSPSRDFNVPTDCVGDLLMVWDFCSSFSRQLHLWPFSLEDFENAICHKESNLVLIVELHACLFRFLIKDNGEYASALKKSKQKSKITLITWSEYLCYFLETMNTSELCAHISFIKRGHYGLLDATVKLGILRELVYQILETSLFKKELDERIEQRHALGAARRGEALEEARKLREEKGQLKASSEANGTMSGHDSETIKGADAGMRNGEVVYSTEDDDLLVKSENKLLENGFHKKIKIQNMNVKTEPAMEESSTKEQPKLLKDNKKETTAKSSKEERKEYYEREMEKRVVRTNPLGKDRHYNRYWWFRRDGRIFIESSDSKEWAYYCSKEEVDLLMGSLNCKGERERSLQKQLEKFYDRICSALQKRSKAIALKIELEEAMVRRSTRVRAPVRENPANAFLNYINKWKED